MNIIFTKKTIASILVAVMLLGITSPVFAAFKNLEFISIAEMDEMKEFVVDGRIEMEISEELAELEGLPIYNENEKIIGKLKLGNKIYMLEVCAEDDETLWIKIELENGVKAYINLLDEPLKEDPEMEAPEIVEPEKEPETPAEPEKEPETPAEPEKDNEFNFIDNILGNSFITEMKNMFKDTLSKVLENSEILKNLNFSDEEKKLVEEVETDFKDFVLKFSKVTLQIGRRVLSDISKTFFDKIGKLDKEPEVEEPEVEEPEVEEPEVEEPEVEEPEVEEPEVEEPEVEEPEVEEPEVEEPEVEEPEVQKPQRSDFLSSIMNTILPNSGKLTDIMQNVGAIIKPVQDVVSSIFGSSNGLMGGLSGITDVVTNLVGNLPFLNMF